MKQTINYNALILPMMITVYSGFTALSLWIYGG